MIGVKMGCRPKATGRIVLGFKEYKVCPFGSDKKVTVILVNEKHKIFMTVPRYKKNLRS